jgi:hypothetical protein
VRGGEPLKKKIINDDDENSFGGETMEKITNDER